MRSQSDGRSARLTRNARIRRVVVRVGSFQQRVLWTATHDDVMRFPCSLALQSQQRPVSRRFAGADRDHGLTQLDLSVYFFVVSARQFDRVAVIFVRIRVALPVVVTRTLAKPLRVLHPHEQRVADLLCRTLRQMVSQLRSGQLVLRETGVRDSAAGRDLRHAR